MWKITVIFGLGKAVSLLSRMGFLFLRISEKTNVRQEARKQVKGRLAHMFSLYLGIGMVIMDVVIKFLSLVVSQGLGEL